MQFTIGGRPGGAARRVLRNRRSPCHPAFVLPPSRSAHSLLRPCPRLPLARQRFITPPMPFTAHTQFTAGRRDVHARLYAHHDVRRYAHRNARHYAYGYGYNPGAAAAAGVIGGVLGAAAGLPLWVRRLLRTVWRVRLWRLWLGRRLRAVLRRLCLRLQSRLLRWPLSSWLQPFRRPWLRRGQFRPRGRLRRRSLRRGQFRPYGRVRWRPLRRRPLWRRRAFQPLADDFTFGRLMRRPICSPGPPRIGACRKARRLLRLGFGLGELFFAAGVSWAEGPLAHDPDVKGGRHDPQYCSNFGYRARHGRFCVVVSAFGARGHARRLESRARFKRGCALERADAPGEARVNRVRSFAQ